MSARVRSGLDVALRDGLRLPGRGRTAVLCNNATLDSMYRATPDALLDVRGVKLDRILSPQHGFAAEKQDNMIESGHGTHRSTGRPIWSLYSETRRPVPQMLADLDAVVVDVQDAGTRVYTFLITALYVLEAADAAGLPVWVLDRPNPIGGVDVEGPVLESAMQSFVGHVAVPLRHGLTSGEYLRMGRDLLGLSVELSVVRMDGWNREAFYDETDLPWAMPSPNLPTLDTALVYPGGVLLEGTNLSEGRGTTRPFEIFGAPWMVPADIATRVARWGLDGFHLREVAYEPTFHKFAGTTVRGFQTHVTNRRSFRPVAAYTGTFIATRERHPADFAWREPPYEYETERSPIDLLYGTSRVREAIEDGADLPDLLADWRPGEDAFRKVRKPFLLYPEADATGARRPPVGSS